MTLKKFQPNVTSHTGSANLMCLVVIPFTQFHFYNVGRSCVLALSSVDSASLIRLNYDPFCFNHLLLSGQMTIIICQQSNTWLRLFYLKFVYCNYWKRSYVSSDSLLCSFIFRYSKLAQNLSKVTKCWMMAVKIHFMGGSIGNCHRITNLQ